MSYYEKLLKLETIYERLQDEESRFLFRARVDYMITRDSEKYEKDIFSLNKQWICKELEEKLQKTKIERIVIFGSGSDGKLTKRALDVCNYSLACFCDSDLNKVGTDVDGLPVIAVDEVIKNVENTLIIIASRKYKDEMYELLKKKGVVENILIPKHGALYAVQGTQYFDVFNAETNEVFVDAGSFAGGTIQDFISWTGGEYNKIFAFEPLKEMHQYIKDRCNAENWKNVITYKKATWNQEETLFFIEEGSGSRIEQEGETRIEGIDIDSIVGNEKVTYIKMDIEGAELKALEGAKYTILKNKPKLAICIYHKPYDVVDLAEYILELVPEYKLFIRHYCFNMWETVLYATI